MTKRKNETWGGGLGAGENLKVLSFWHTMTWASEPVLELWFAQWVW